MSTVQLCSQSDIATYFPALASLSYLDSLITVASEVVFNFTGRTVLTVTSSIVEKVSGGPLSRDLGIYGQSTYANSPVFGSALVNLELRNFPIVSVSSVVDSFGTAITDYQILSGLGVLYRATGWSAGVENYTVTYSAGSTAEGVKHAAILMVRHLYDDMLLGNGGQIKTRTLADSTIEYFEAPAAQLPMYVQLLLRPYRNLNV